MHVVQSNVTCTARGICIPEFSAYPNPGTYQSDSESAIVAVTSSLVVAAYPGPPSRGHADSKEHAPLEVLVIAVLVPRGPTIYSP